MQWYSQEGQDVMGTSPEKEIYGGIYKLNFVTERKSLLTGGQSVLAHKEIMWRNDVFLIKIDNDKFHRVRIIIDSPSHSYEVYYAVHSAANMQK